MNDPEHPAPPEEWLDALERADADVAAGRTVSGEAILRHLRRTLAEMEKPATGDQSSEAVRRR